MADETGKSEKIILYGGLGLLAVAIVALLVKNKSSSTGLSGGNTAAIQAIGASNINAQTTQADIEKAIISANQSIMIDAQDNATLLSGKQIDATTTISEAQLTSDLAKTLAQIQSVENITTSQAQASAAVSEAQAAAPPAPGFWSFLTNAASAVANIFAPKLPTANAALPAKQMSMNG